MLAMILAGGMGNRLGMGEKPLVRIADQPMVSCVVNAFLESGFETLVITSPFTPLTMNWCRANGIGYMLTSGTGYVEDIMEAVEELGEDGCVFTCVADLPLITPEIIGKIAAAHGSNGLPACSVWVPEGICMECGCRPGYMETIRGVRAAPAGVNIIRASLFSSGREQEEYRLLLEEKRLCFNINTPDELKAAENFLSRTLS